LIRLYAAS